MVKKIKIKLPVSSGDKKDQIIHFIIDSERVMPRLGLHLTGSDCFFVRFLNFYMYTYTHTIMLSCRFVILLKLDAVCRMCVCRVAHSVFSWKDNTSN